MRVVRSGLIDCRSNAPEMALWRPLLVANRPGEAHVVPGALSDEKVILTLVDHVRCSMACASQGYHGDSHALENLWVCDYVCLAVHESWI